MKELSEQIEIFLCDLFNLKRLNVTYDAYDPIFKETIEIKAASRFIWDSGSKRTGRFWFNRLQHEFLKDTVDPHYLFCVYDTNGKISILGLKKVSWKAIDKKLNFENSDFDQLTISKVFRMSDLRPQFTIEEI